MRIEFSPEFYKYTCFQEYVEIKGGNVGNVLEALFNQFPQLMVFLLGGKGEEAQKTTIQLNGEYLVEAYSIWIAVEEGDVLRFGRDIPEGENATVKTIAGVVIAAVGIIAEQPWMVALGASLMLSGVSEFISGSPVVSDSTSSSSSTYSFSGIKNTTTPGTPVSIVYGRHRVGGHILNAYTDTIASQNYLYTEIGLSEGEIDSIDEGSVEANTRSLKTLDDVALYWRSGDSQQAAQIPLRTPTEGVDTEEFGQVQKIYWTLNRTVGDIGVYKASYTIINTAVINKLYFRATINTDSFQYYWGGGSNSVRHVWYWIRATKPDGAVLAEISPFDSGNIAYVWNNLTLLFDSYNGNINLEFYIARSIDSSTTGVPVEFYSYTLCNTTLGEEDTFNYIRGFNRIENTVSYNQRITKPDPDMTDGAPTHALQVTTQSEVEAVKLNISAPSGIYKTGTALEETSVVFEVYYKRQSDTEYIKYIPPGATNWMIIKGKTKSEVVITRIINFPGSNPLDIYDIKIARVTEDHESSLYYVDTIYLKDVTEIKHGGEIYPHTALLGIRVKATDQLSGSMPIFTSIIKGIKVAVPTGYDGVARKFVGEWDGTLATKVDGSLNKQWTNNPVWCLYDLLTNTRYGLGNYFKIKPYKKGLMLANFKMMADYCDERVNDDGSEGDSSALGGRPRFSLDLVIDESKSAKDWIQNICAVMRATCYYVDGCIYLDIDRKKPITQLFNMSNLYEYTQTGLSTKSISNTFEVQFYDSAQNYDSSILLIEDPDYQADQTKEEHKKTLSIPGVTDKRQAISLAKYALYGTKLSNTTVSFKTGTQGLMSWVGDVVGIQHDVPQWGFGGKVKAVTTVTPEVELRLDLSDSFIYGENGLTGALKISISHKGSLPVELDVYEPSVGTYDEISVSPTYLDSNGDTQVFTVEKGDTYIIGAASNTVKPFKIASIKRAADELVEIIATEYSEELYDICDNVIDGTQVYIPNYSTLKSPTNVSVSGFKAEEKIYQDSTGNIKTGVDIWYTVPTEVFWAGCRVAYGIDGVFDYTAVDTTGRITIPDITREGNYQFVALSLFKNGTRQTIAEALADSVNIPYAYLYLTPFVKNDEMLKGVTGLEVIGSLDGSFNGKDCKLQWRKPIVIDSFINTAAGTEAAISTKSWLSYYEVEILNIDGSRRRLTRVYDEKYIYSYEANREDGTKAVREFDVSVVVYDRLGRKSNPSVLRCSNPVPVALA